MWKLDIPRQVDINSRPQILKRIWTKIQENPQYLLEPENILIFDHNFFADIRLFEPRIADFYSLLNWVETSYRKAHNEGGTFPTHHLTRVDQVPAFTGFSLAVAASTMYIPEIQALSVRYKNKKDWTQIIAVMASNILQRMEKIFDENRDVLIQEMTNISKNWWPHYVRISGQWNDYSLSKGIVLSGKQYLEKTRKRPIKPVS